jgi:ATP-dependent DNA helicase RecQ
VTEAESRKEARRAARETLGYDRLRAGQEEAIAAVLEGEDTLAVLPTGLGKSAIYQLAGSEIEGYTLVISPLIALQKDQVESIKTEAVGDAAVLNSQLSDGRREEVLSELDAGQLEFLFLAPEQFESEPLLERLAARPPSLFVVDEAHCISEWGHDFRPAYLRLGAVIESLSHPIVLALTATAAPPVREEIVQRLGMRDARVVVRGFDRPNIWLGVEAFADEVAKRRALVERVLARSAAGEAGIVYAATRRHAEELEQELLGAGAAVAVYHAGLSKKQRDALQERFMTGESEVIVATSAFGMGIDKRDIRFVYHLDVPDSVDSYYQGVGRAGRDGEEASGVLFYRAEDLGLQRYFGGGAGVDEELLAWVLRRLPRSGAGVVFESLLARADCSEAKLRSALTLLADAGAVEISSADDAARVPGTKPREAIEAALALQARRDSYGRSKIEMMRGYAETRGCRREFLLTYFGEPFAGPCGNCDNCDAGMQEPADGHAEGAFPVGSRVEHAHWGGGQVMRHEPGRVVVLFESVGYKTLGLELVEEQALLTAK